jgi:hypothetical protein
MPHDSSRERVLDTGWRFWSRWTCAVGAGFGVALIGMGAAKASGSPMVGWCIGYFTAVAMCALDRAFVRALRNPEADEDRAG